MSVLVNKCSKLYIFLLFCITLLCLFVFGACDSGDTPATTATSTVTATPAQSSEPTATIAPSGTAMETSTLEPTKTPAPTQDENIEITKGSLIINEFGIDNKSGSWIEIKNMTDKNIVADTLSLEITCDKTVKIKLGELKLSQGEIKVFYGDKTGFELGENGKIIIYNENADKSEVIDETTFLGLEDNYSLYKKQDKQTYVKTRFITPGFSNDDAGYESYCKSETTGDIIINEVMVSNDWYLKQSDNKFYDWVEIKNSSDKIINLSEYVITDKNSKMKYERPSVQLNPGQLYVIICSAKTTQDSTGYYHTGFALNATSENLYIFKKDGTLVDYAYLAQIPYGGTYGRMNGQNGYYFFTKATPGSENTSSVRQISAPPLSNYQPGVYNVPSMDVSFESDGVIYYTTDGTEPTKKSAVYSKPININSNTIIRTLVSEEGKLSPGVSTYSYILNPDTTLPVLSLVTAPDNLWDEEIGIYVKGKHDNYFQNWERPASFSYFGDDGTFSVNCGLKLNGEGSRASDEKKSFKVMFRAQYGASTLKFNLFNNGITEYDSLVIRAGEDYRYSVFRNEMVAAFNRRYMPSLVVQSGKHCSLYINGEYFGIYYLMERVTEKYIAEKYDVPEEEVIIEDFSPEDSSELGSLMLFSKSNDMSVKENYDYITSKIDIESMTDWFIIQAYSGNTDIVQNVKYAKLGAEGKWKWVAHDFDWAFYKHDTPFENVLVKNLWYTSRFIQPMLKNAEYKEYFIQRFAYHAKYSFNDPTNLTDIIDEYYKILEPEMAKERARWGRTVDSWKKYVANLKSFVTDYDRLSELKESLISVFSLTEEDVQKYFN